MGTGMVEESRSATAPAPQNPSLRMAGRMTRFHFCRSCTKNCFNHGPLPAANSSIQKDHCTCAGLPSQAGRQTSPGWQSPSGFPRSGRDERMVERTRKPGSGSVSALAPVGRMPLSVVPTSVNEPTRPGGNRPGDRQPSLRPGQWPRHTRRCSRQRLARKRTPTETAPRACRGSRWVDYDTYELLNMISELEDERRWARLREGIWIAILLHLILLSGITWIPKYIFKVPAGRGPVRGHQAAQGRPEISRSSARSDQAGPAQGAGEAGSAEAARRSTRKRSRR